MMSTIYDEADNRVYISPIKLAKQSKTPVEESFLVGEARIL